ncbi:M56 family metallopeptidase [Verrucomicrobiota bacterium sgz303538]
MSASWIAVSLAEITLGLSVLIVCFLVLRPLLRRALGSRWLHGLWLLVLARLVMPWPVETPWSLIDYSRHSKAAPGQEVTVTVSGAALLQSQAIAGEEMQGAKGRAGWNELLVTIWVGGMAVGVVFVLCQWFQTRRWATRTRPADDPGLIEAFESIPVEWRAGVELRQTNSLSLATLAGVRKPQIWFPDRWVQELTNDELRNVLLHELGHARRNDLLAQWLFGIALCLHWFNPLVWIAVRTARFDREMACDEWVLERADENGAEQYGSTLLRIVQMLRTPARISPVVVAMAANRKTLGMRIRQIGAFEPSSAWRGVAGVCVMLVAIAAVTTSRGSEQAESGKVAPTQPASTPAKQEPATSSPEPGNVAPVAAPESEPKVLPEAIPVPEKPGFYRSPFSPDAGFVDLRGFPPGTEVKCPYSGKNFVVPPAENPKPKAPTSDKPVREKAPPSDGANPAKDKPPRPEELPVDLSANEISPFQNGVAVARDHALLRYKDMTMSADTITYDSVRKVAIGVENVEVSSRGNTITGAYIELDLKTTAVRIRGPSRTKIKDVAQ